MSYDIYVFFDGFTEQRYRQFVDNSLHIMGEWKCCESKPLLIDAEPAHEYRIKNLNAIDDERWDVDNVGVWVTLYRNTAPESFDPPFDRFPFFVVIETGAGRTALSMLVQLMIPASAFDSLGPAAVMDLQRDDPANAPAYLTKGEYLKHVRRLCLRWYGEAFLARYGLEGDA